jgi:NADH:ubiquinone reductase (H+-translocating)
MAVQGISRPHVVIVGAGFGGLAAAQGLRSAHVDVTLVDKRNHHLFQPLLYQVATAGLSPADIATPIRTIVQKNPNTRVILDSVIGVDSALKKVILSHSEPLSYDWLVLATGAQHSYFGRDDWAPFAPGIKTIEDATAVRRKVLLAMERAEIETDPSKRKALLTFVVIGGGPTGVEMAGAIAELARCSSTKDFRTITARCCRIILVEGGPRLLQSFPECLSAKAKVAIEQLGVEVSLGRTVVSVSQDGVQIGDEFIAASTAVWAAGVQASRAAEWLGISADRAGRVPVDANLRAPGETSIFVIGDTASCVDASGSPLPGVAPVAKQQGAYVADTIIAAVKGKTTTPFKYKNYGNLATIGRNRAVADFGRFRVSGRFAWLLWCVAHIWFLTGHRNRLIVGTQWFWSYLTFARGARLITGDISPNLPATLQARPELAPLTT